MRDYGVSMDRSTTPTELSFAPGFNVAVPFIDRHLDEGRGDKVAVHEVGGADVTYAKLAENVNRCGNALTGLGVEPGERVLMLVKDGADFVFLFWGAIKAGVIPVPLNTLLRDYDYRFMIENSGCAAVVYSPEYAREVESALKLASHKPKVRMLTEPGNDGDGDTLRARMAEASADLAPFPAAAEADCFWLYSSGTTGDPKAAVHAHQDIVVTSEFYGRGVLGFREDDLCFSAAKLFFAYGLGNSMAVPLWLGATTVLQHGRPTPDSTFDVIERYRPSIFFGVPTLYASQLRALDEAPRNLSSLRACVSAGEALPADIFRRWKEKVGCPILDGIGSTEALNIFISNRLDDHRPGSSGRPVPGYEARVVDETGQETPPGESGGLMIRGASTARYYWNNPEKTRETMIDGWLRTGDTYIRDEDGYFYYCGRDDDMLKVGGIWCSPFEIEARLIEHPKVLEAAVVGKSDADGLVKPAAFVVLNNQDDAGDGLAEALLQHCKSGLARYKYPRWFSFVEELPKTATGKIQRYKLR